MRPVIELERGLRLALAVAHHAEHEARFRIIRILVDYGLQVLRGPLQLAHGQGRAGGFADDLGIMLRLRRRFQCLQRCLILSHF